MCFFLKYQSNSYAKNIPHLEHFLLSFYQKPREAVMGQTGILDDSIYLDAISGRSLESTLDV